MSLRLFAFAVIILLALIALSASEHRPVNAGLPLVTADYPVCITVNPGSLRQEARIEGDNRQRGIA